MERKEAIKYQQVIDEFMDSAQDRKWLADCVLKSSPYMTNEQCRMIEITLATILMWILRSMTQQRIKIVRCAEAEASTLPCMLGNTTICQ